MGLATSGTNAILGNMLSAVGSICLSFLPLFFVLGLVYFAIWMFKRKHNSSLYSASDLRALRIAKVSGYESTGSRNRRGELMFAPKGSSSGSNPSVLRRGGSSPEIPMVKRGGGYE